ncbi:MAG: hypothetical protein ACJAVS_001857, partial [Paracoccaceae bacterium]|jgi:hypothetical protein
MGVHAHDASPASTLPGWMRTVGVPVAGGLWRLADGGLIAGAGVRFLCRAQGDEAADAEYIRDRRGADLGLA